VFGNILDGHVPEQFQGVPPQGPRVANARINKAALDLTDGIDQTALLLLGEGHSRRSYMFRYSSTDLGVVRMGDLKMFFTGENKGGLPALDMYNIVCDPREDHQYKGCMIHRVPLQNLMKSHMAMKKKFSDRVLPPPQDGPLELGN